MATYSWRCQESDCREITHGSITVGPVAPICHDQPMLRDYRADRLQLSIHDLHQSNRVGHNAAHFLPDAEYYKSPTDPDGTKGLRKWNEEHIPKGHSGRTRPGGRELKQVF